MCWWSMRTYGDVEHNALRRETAYEIAMRRSKKQNKQYGQRDSQLETSTDTADEM